MKTKTKTHSAAKTTKHKAVKKAPAKTAKKAENPGLAAVRAKLEEMRDDVEKRIQFIKSQNITEAEVGDGVDQAAQSIEKELTFETSDKEHLVLEQVEAALRKLDKGIYGICESCRSPILKKRLQAMPYARYCLKCQNTSEYTPQV